MLLLIHRPGYQHPWSEKSYYTQIALHLLDDADSGAVIATVLGVPEIPPDVRTLISQKAVAIRFISKSSRGHV